MFKKEKQNNYAPKKEPEEELYRTKIDIGKLIEMEVPEFTKWWVEENEKQTNNRAPLTNLPTFYLLTLIHLKQIRWNVRKLVEQKNAQKENN